MDGVRLTEAEIADLMSPAPPVACAPWVPSISEYRRRDDMLTGAFAKFGEGLRVVSRPVLIAITEKHNE
jgi:hypothetical protein